ncbi:MAG TPA: SEC-C domain-containing protein [Acidimicrobiia bacterium]|nr:SEC-C domain-containing protein [Acidimicrobiia bacterium]
MDLDRGTLARLDRRLLAGLGGDERFQMVRVPVTPAKWSTWKRYCDKAGISMGRGIVVLMDHELASVFDHSSEGAVSSFEERVQQQMAEREAALTKREQELGAAEERVRRWSDHLRGREQELEIREWRVDAATKLSTQAAQVRSKLGRNERCPCGSGLKYKRCHGEGWPSRPWE